MLPHTIVLPPTHSHVSLFLPGHSLFMWNEPIDLFDDDPDSDEENEDVGTQRGRGVRWVWSKLLVFV